jgi:carboxylesterase
MSWHGQINRTVWEIQERVNRKPEVHRYRRELLRAHFLQHFEFDKAFHVPRDDRSFLFLQEEEAPACLLLHGAQGTPAEMRELGSYLYSRGYTVYCPRFSRTDTKERMVSWESWVTMAQSALEAASVCSKTPFVVGLSLGATIAMVLSHLVDGLHGAVLLAPALYPKAGIKTRIYQFGRKVTPTLFYRLAGWNGEVLKAMDYVKRRARKIEIPVLAIQAADDTHLSHRGLKFVRRHCSHPSTDAVLLPHGTHVLTRGPAKDEVFTRVHEFLEANQKAARQQPQHAEAPKDS